MINSKFKTKHNNEFINLAEHKVGFYVDHLYLIPNSRILVFFPYDIDAEMLSKLNDYCDEHDYDVKVIGGESVYGGKSMYTNGTITIALTHKKDNYSKVELLEQINKLNEMNVGEDERYEGLNEDEIKIVRLRKTILEKKIKEENEKFENMSDEEIMKYWESGKL